MKKRSPTKPKSPPVVTAAPPTLPVWRRWGPLLAIVAVVLVGYYQVAWHNFVAWDDNNYVRCLEPGEMPNQRVASGLNWDNVGWALTTDHFSNWHPIVWLSYMLDVQLFGLNAPAMLIENVLLHLANSLLLYGLLVRLTGARGRSLFVALLFAVHPLHVESVAWVSERKDVLSTLFWLLTTWAYVRYTERSNAARYLLMLGCFVLGLMTKPMLVTLPCTLFLLDYWPLRRFAFQAQGRPEDCFPQVSPNPAFPGLTKPLAQLVLEKLPMFVLIGGSVSLTIWAQFKGGAIRTLDEMPLLVRLSNVSTAYFGYLKLMVWPWNLTCLYPYPITNASSYEARQQFLVWGLIAAVAIVAITVACVMVRRRWPYLLFGWLWYLGTLVPVIGLLQVGLSSMADRYTYVPLIGVFVALTWWVADLLPDRPGGRPYLAIAGTVIIVACLGLTWRQVGFWRDTDTLLGHALAITQDNYYLDRQWAVVLKKRARIEEALPYFQRCATRPDLAKTHAEYGAALLEVFSADKKRHELLQPAQEQLEWAGRLATDPTEKAIVLANLGAVYEHQQRHDEAIRTLQDAVELNQDNGDAQNNLAFTLKNQSRYREALPAAEAGVRLAPQNIERRILLAEILLNLGERPRAMAVLQEALRIDPTNQKVMQQLRLLRF